MNSDPSYLAECGIQHRLTCPHTYESEQNGLVERRHRLIVEVMLGLLFLPKLLYLFITGLMHFLRQCSLKTGSVAIILLGGLTPYDKLYQKQPDYSIQIQ